MTSTQAGPAENNELDLAQELGKAREELNEFVYIVSHDLKAPLRAIDSLASWIVSDYADQLDEEGQELLNLLSSRVKRMNHLMDGLLQYSRVGRIELEREEIDLQQLLPALIERLDLPDHIKISVENRLPVISAELARIEQVFQNLLQNAVDFMDKSAGEITVDCVEQEAQWRFCVADNGPGIDEKYFDKIFKIFQTLQPRDKVESSGVGLALVKKIIDTYGGKIWVESETAGGSRFYFTLPKKSN